MGEQWDGVDPLAAEAEADAALDGDLGEITVVETAAATESDAGHAEGNTGNKDEVYGTRVVGGGVVEGRGHALVVFGDVAGPGLDEAGDHGVVVPVDAGDEEGLAAGERVLRCDLHAANYAGQRAVGDFLRELLAPGATIDAPELLQRLTGTKLEASAMRAYFAPLEAHLKERNAGRVQTLR